jgi:peptidoglycan/xylan/chitin deacetylase (PgdA/CDA1 family)
MIGVLHNADEHAAVEEFFQLFKTPWEPCVPGESYDVVIATNGDVPEVDTALLLVFGAARSPSDVRLGFRPGILLRAACLEFGDTRIPAYGEVLTFVERDGTTACVRSGGRVAGLTGDVGGRRVLRLGYDLFREVRHLLSVGQPPEHAAIPSLDLHIDRIRQWILEAGLPLVEIPPTPADCCCAVCLTHDIDFIGIRRHLLDHTMWGFVFRATVGAVRDYARGTISFGRLGRCWRAVLTLPFVYLGLAKDFWHPFDWLLEVEKGLPATYFLIPFKRRPGEKVPAPHAARRATAYDITDIPEWTDALVGAGCEVGVHGIDAWHSVPRGQDERRQIAAATGASKLGIRMHWLLRDEQTPQILEDAGFAYDSTVGYNETVGFRAGTLQVFRPEGTRALLELPLHVQDGALFFPHRLNLTEDTASERCQVLFRQAQNLGGVLTILWHDRSHAPERLWGDFYRRLIEGLKSHDVWFATAGQAVDWFRARRGVRFDRGPGGSRSASVVARCAEGPPIRPFTVRLHAPGSGRLATASGARWTDIRWSGEKPVDLSALRHATPEDRGAPARCLEPVRT